MTLPAPHPGRTSLVTGASSGIGSEIARLLAARGHAVTLVARREDRLMALANELSGQHGVRTEVIAADLTDEASREGIVDQLGLLGLGVNILVNNAGMTTLGPVSGASVASELAMIRTDVEAVVHLCTVFLPAMVERRSGAVLNVASTAAFQPLPGQAGYGASKAFVLSYTQAIRAELRQSGVTVTALCPGPVATGFAEAAGFTDAEAAKSLPKAMWVPVADVARAAVDGMDAARTVVIPGTVNRIAAAAAWIVPRSLLSPVLARRHPALRR